MISNIQKLDRHFGGTKIIAYGAELDINQFHPGVADSLGVQLPPALGSAVAKRQGEYIAGRYCAKYCLEELGSKQLQVRCHPDRSPIWPAGFVGSISHSRDYAVAIAANAEHYLGMGIDVENYGNHSKDIKALICDSTDLDTVAVSGLDENVGLLLCFSIKESFYKAIYPSIRQILDFSAVSITSLEPKAGRFSLIINQQLDSPYTEGHAVNGDFTLESDWLMSWVVLSHPMR